MDLAKMTAKQRENYHYMGEAMRRLEWDLHNHIEATGRIPTEWHDIARTRHPQPTERVTVRLDRDVLRFFRSMGAGYGPRLNEVLRSYMHARLAGVIKGPDTMDFYRKQRDDHDGARPMWGGFAEVETGTPPDEADVKAEAVGQVRERIHLRKAEG
jgi:uncharacterized protein (DUF4415 family)